MAIARSSKVMEGTSDSSGTTIADDTTNTGSEVDMTGDNISGGWAHFYMKYTGTQAAGTIVAHIIPRRITAEIYLDQLPAANKKSFTPVNGTERIFLGTFFLSRFMSVNVITAGIGAGVTNVFVSAEVFKIT